MSLVIENYSSTTNLFAQAATNFLRMLDETVQRKDFFDVALSGGTTAKDFFHSLALLGARHVNLSKIRFFFSDERVAPLKSADSNAGQAWSLLLEPLGISESQFFPMYDEKNSADTCARNYEVLLSTLLVKDYDDTPVFDALYLGIGLDGHTASLFPHSAVLSKDLANRVTCAVHEQSLAHERITLMPKTIAAARHVCILATGAPKGKLIETLVHGAFEPDTYPVQLVMREPKNEVLLMATDLPSIS